jgi:hypothetical protein
MESWCSVRRAIGRSPDPHWLFLRARAMLMGARNGALGMAYSLSASAARCWKTRSQMPDLAQREIRAWTLIGSPEPLRRIAPGDAGAVAVENGLDEPTVVTRRRAHSAVAARQRILEPVPLVIKQAMAAHRSASSGLAPCTTNLPNHHSPRGFSDRQPITRCVA